MLTGETPPATFRHFRVSVCLRVNRRDFSSSKSAKYQWLGRLADAYFLGGLAVAMQPAVKHDLGVEICGVLRLVRAGGGLQGSTTSQMVLDCGAGRSSAGGSRRADGPMNVGYIH